MKPIDRISNVRYGKLGWILFEYKGESYVTPEPIDVMPAIDNVGTNAKASLAWALKQVLSGVAKQVE